VSGQFLTLTATTAHYRPRIIGCLADQRF